MDSVVQKIRTIFFCFILLFFAQGRVAAQSDVPGEYQVAGEVIDKKTGQPVSEAVVSIASMKATVTADGAGRFKIDVPAVSVCTLTVTKSGYERASVPVDPEMENEFIEIALEPADLSELEKLTVKADRKKKKATETVSQISISPELVTKLPNIGQADLFRSLQLLPGVSGTNESTSGLYVRGGTPDQNLILLDGIPIYYVDHFYGFFSAFNPRAIEEVSLYKGGFGSQWGGRLSSVVELTSNGKNNKFDPDKARVTVGTGLLSSDAIVEIPLKNNELGTVMLAGRRSMTDLYETDLFTRLFNRVSDDDSLSTGTSGNSDYGGLSSTVQQDRFAYQPEYSFWDVNGLAAFRLGTRGRLVTTFFASRDFEDNSIDTSWTFDYVDVGMGGFTPEGELIPRYDTITTTATINDKTFTRWGNLCGGQEWKQQWTDAFTGTLKLSYSEFTDKKELDYFRTDQSSHHYSDTTSPTDTLTGQTSWMASTNKITDISGRSDNSFKLTGWNTIKAGLEVSRKSVIYERDTILPDTNSLEWRSTPPSLRVTRLPIHSYDTGYSAAVYAGDEMTFGGKAGVTLGARLYYFDLLSSFTVDPRISGWLKPLPDLKVKGAWGIYTQEIHRAEQDDIMGGSNFVWLLATENRPPEKSQHFIGGVSWERRHFLFDVEAYYKRLTGLLTVSEQSPLTWLPQYAFNPDELALYEGTGTARGVELLAQAKDLTIPLLSRDLTWDGWAAYTWSRVENTYAVFNVGNPFPATQDRTHEVKIVSNLEWDVATWSSVSLGAVWLYSTGTPYTVPIGEFRVDVIGDHTSTTLHYVSDKNKYRLPDYHRLDVSAGWKVHFGKHVRSSLTMGFFNAYNHENILERTYKENQISSYGTRTTTYTPIDKLSIPVMFNAALEVSAQF